MYVDVLYRRKGTKANSFVFLEIKCTRSASALINGIKKDIAKVSGIRKTDYDQRSFWCLGFHHDCDEKSVKAVMEYGKQWFYSKHQIIRLCDCEGEHLAECKNRKIGLLIC